MEIKQASPVDLKVIAVCHRSAFPYSLTSKMGVKYLEKIFSWYLSTDKAFLFFLKENDQIVGYAGGIIVDGTLAHGSASSMTQHTFNDAVKALMFRPWLLLHRDFVTRYGLFTRNIVTRLRNKFRKVEIRSAVAPKEPHVGLVVIGVDPAFQGKGYGSQLLQEFERVSKNLGFDKMMLTVRSDNSNAIKSYERNGWSISKVEGVSTSMEKRLF
jgi:ribosomal protein S18 acetylase RimI-like enzyme